MHARIISILLCCAALTLLAGCGLFQRPPAPSSGNARPGADVALTAHTPVSLQYYKTARVYASEGRLELAREHYLLAYAAAGDDAALQAVLETELKAVTRMIHALR